MPISILVRNIPPETDRAVGKTVLSLFEDYTSRTQGGSPYPPFRHQAEAFRLIAKNKEVFLVAGTAAGKTLAVAVPLIRKIVDGRIRKILFMYPTVALMDDQRKVMDSLADISGLEVGRLQGGMSRTELIAALNKPVILSTPDEIYWFFRKNVKYSGLLIYGLCLVDEFVLDEAHLFNGLTLQNLSHFKERVQLLASRLGRVTRWHILTATPTHALRNLTGGEEVNGGSRCGDVEVSFLEPAATYKEREEKLLGSVETAFTTGAQKVLLVLNSADFAHRIFESIKGGSKPDLPLDILWRFGGIRWKTLKAFIADKIEDEILNEIESRLGRQDKPLLKDLPAGEQVHIPTDTLAEASSRMLENHLRASKRLAFTAHREETGNLTEALDRHIGQRSKTARVLWNEFRQSLTKEISMEELISGLDTQVAEINGALEHAWAGEELRITAPDFPEFTASMKGSGLSPGLADQIGSYLKYTVELPEQAASELKTPAKKSGKCRIAFPWLDWLIKDPSRRKPVINHLWQALADKKLEAEARHIATWGDTDVPVVIYTGKMQKAEREGLIEAFSALPKAILISTPAVEVGVDFEADFLVTEECDGNGFLQRFGRVGRRRGVRSKAAVLVKSGDAFVKLHQRHSPEMSREGFSHLMADPLEGVFPPGTFADDSGYLSAMHVLVNEQLGEIGRWLNQNMFDDSATALARELRSARLPFTYGLRGTMPGIALRGSDGGGEPFHILRKVENERLIPGDSSFEMGRADMAYLEFLWKKAAWKTITVDARATLQASHALFWLEGDRWCVQPGQGICADYAQLFHPAIEKRLCGLEGEIQRNPEGFLEKLRPYAAKPRVRPILRVGRALCSFFSPCQRLLLGQGDVHLQRVDEEGIIQPVEDRLGNPLLIPDQRWLILFGQSREEAHDALKRISALDLEEVIYDWETINTQGVYTIGPVLLERVAGACFDVYQRLAANAGG